MVIHVSLGWYRICIAFPILMFSNQTIFVFQCIDRTVDVSDVYDGGQVAEVDGVNGVD